MTVSSNVAQGPSNNAASMYTMPQNPRDMYDPRRRRHESPQVSRGSNPSIQAHYAANNAAPMIFSFMG